MCWTSTNESAIAGTGVDGALSLFTRTANQSDWFVLADESATVVDRGARSDVVGDVRNVNIGGDNLPTSIDRDQEPVGSGRNNFARLRDDTTAADVACTINGDCMTVWDDYDNCSTMTISQINVDKGDEDGSPGIEPGIYIDRLDGRGPQLLWFPQFNGGNDMKDKSSRGPNSNGFPVTTTYCGDARISVEEVDGIAADRDANQVLQWTNASYWAPWGDFLAIDENTVLDASLWFTSADYRDVKQGGLDACWNKGLLVHRVDHQGDRRCEAAFQGGRGGDHRSGKRLEDAVPRAELCWRGGHAAGGRHRRRGVRDGVAAHCGRFTKDLHRAVRQHRHAGAEHTASGRNGTADRLGQPRSDLDRRSLPDGVEPGR